MALAVLVCAGSTDAQDREGRWEFALGLSYQLSTGRDFEGGSTIDTDNDFGFVTDFGYNFTDNVAVTFGLQYAGVGYDAGVITEGNEEIGISGTLRASGHSR